MAQWDTKSPGKLVNKQVRRGEPSEITSKCNGKRKITISSKRLAKKFWFSENMLWFGPLYVTHRVWSIVSGVWPRCRWSTPCYLLCYLKWPWNFPPPGISNFLEKMLLMMMVFWTSVFFCLCDPLLQLLLEAWSNNFCTDHLSTSKKEWHENPEA